MSSRAIDITELPSEWTAKTLAEVLPIYKQFRLFSLKTAPNAFAMTYNQETLFPVERWEQRLSNPDAVQFIATYKDARPAREAWKRTPWLGSLVLVRKTSAKEENTFDGGVHIETKAAGQSTLVFHMNAVFLDPAVRGQGLSKKLVQAGIQFVQSEARDKGAEKIRITTLVDSWNEVAIGLYASQGFAKIGVDTYTIDKEQREAVEMECVLAVDRSY